jgi:hypothetical protein
VKINTVPANAAIIGSRRIVTCSETLTSEACNLTAICDQAAKFSAAEPWVMIEDTDRKRLARRYPLILAVLIFALAFWLSLTTMLDGFPDRFMSEQDAAEDQLIGVFNWISDATGVWFVCLAIAAGRLNVRKIHFASAMFYLAVIVIALLIDLYFRDGHLMDSRGG